MNAATTTTTDPLYLDWTVALIVQEVLDDHFMTEEEEEEQYRAEAWAEAGYERMLDRKAREEQELEDEAMRRAGIDPRAF